MSLLPESMLRSPRRGKVVGPILNKEGFGAAFMSCVHNTLGEIWSGEFSQHCAGIVKEEMPGLFVEIRQNRLEHGKIPCTPLL